MNSEKVNDKRLLRVHPVQLTGVLLSHSVYSLFLVVTQPCEGKEYCCHLTGKETEGQKVTYTKSQSQYVINC